jgi:hypothetical protein
MKRISKEMVVQYSNEPICRMASWMDEEAFRTDGKKNLEVLDMYERYCRSNRSQGAMMLGDWLTWESQETHNPSQKGELKSANRKK